MFTIRVEVYVGFIAGTWKSYILDIPFLNGLSMEVMVNKYMNYHLNDFPDDVVFWGIYNIPEQDDVEENASV